ncbi:hypothetical protein M1D96_06360 [Pseudomonas sp. D1-3]
MTTPIVPSITDEQLAELEESVVSTLADPELSDKDVATVMAIGGIIARLRASEKEAARYRWLRDEKRFTAGEMFGHLMVVESEGEDCYFGDKLDSVIDLHMEHHP